ncbi:MAG: N-acetyltransferase [Acidimicrobiia bacterium]
MSEPFIPKDFEVPMEFDGPGFHLEPLAPVHNERDHEAWMSSIDHIRATPGMGSLDWPAPMTLEENMADMEMHAREFRERKSFTYSILDGDEVIGCVYVYPSRDSKHDAVVRSWVTAERSVMDRVVWEALSEWLSTAWPFRSVAYATRV